MEELKSLGNALEPLHSHFEGGTTEKSSTALSVN